MQALRFPFIKRDRRLALMCLNVRTTAHHAYVDGQ